jgi:hypothetical protein
MSDEGLGMMMMTIFTRGRFGKKDDNDRQKIMKVI